MSVGQTEVATVAELIDHGPEALAEWLRGAAAGLKRVPEEFNWRGLAFGAAAQTRQATANDLLWAQSAVAIYEQLAEREHEPAKRSSDLLSANLLRARMIALYGSVSGDRVLDVRNIKDWFFADLALTLEEASRNAADWQTKPVEEIRLLRQLKNRLGVVRYLHEQKPELVPVALQPWLAIFENLP